MATSKSKISLLNQDHKFELQNELHKLPSHFNKKIEQDQNRLLYVYNEIVFKMDTMPDVFKPVLVNLIGFIECARGNGKRGARCFLNVSKLDEGNVICLANNAYMALKANDYTKVEDAIAQISRLQRNGKAHAGQIAAEVGHFYQWFGLNCAALKEYRKALEDDPDNMISMYGLAVVLYELSKHEGRENGFKYLTNSLELFKRILRILPDFTLARIYEGKARNQLIHIAVPDSHGDEEADRIFTQVMDTDCAPEILCMIGEEYLKQGVLDGEPCATSIFRRALEKRKNSKVYHLLALALRATYFKENPDMYEVFRQGMFMKANKAGAGSLPPADPPQDKKPAPPPKKPLKQKEQAQDEDPLAEEKEEKVPSEPVTLDDVIETLTTTVKMSRGSNREAVFDLAESLWLAGERLKAVTNFELATLSENAIIQVKAHLRLSQAFIDDRLPETAEYHLNHIMKLDSLENDETLRTHYLRLVYDLTMIFIRSNKSKKATEWVKINEKLVSPFTTQLKQHMVYTKFSRQ